MGRKLSEAHKAAMAEGRNRARKEARVESDQLAISRVVAFKRWTLRGSVGPCPVVPTDEEWAVARSAGKVA